MSNFKTRPQALKATALSSVFKSIYGFRNIFKRQISNDEIGERNAVILKHFWNCYFTIQESNIFCLIFDTTIIVRNIFFLT